MKTQFTSLALVAIVSSMFMAQSMRAADPLLSWNDTAPKKAVVAFAEKAPVDTASAPARAGWARGGVAAVVAILLCAFVLRRSLVPAMGRLLAPLRPHHLQPLNPKSETAKP